MDVDVALGTLNLSDPFTRDELRRAYLRGVKAHPPERDPNGFRKVREAYEILDARSYVRASVASAASPLQRILESAPTEPGSSLPDADLSPTQSQSGTEPPGRIQRALDGLGPELVAEVTLALAVRQGWEREAGHVYLEAVDVALMLFEAGNFALAARLADAIAQLPLDPRSSLPQSAARQVLASELARLVDFDAPLTRLLAAGLLREGLSTIAKDLNTADIRLNYELAEEMPKRSPSLWSGVKPLLRSQAPERWPVILMFCVIVLGTIAVNAITSDLAHDKRQSRGRTPSAELLGSSEVRRSLTFKRALQQALGQDVSPAAPERAPSRATSSAVPSSR